MRQNPAGRASSSEQIIKDIKRKKYSALDKREKIKQNTFAKRCCTINGTPYNMKMMKKYSLSHAAHLSYLFEDGYRTRLRLTCQYPEN